MTEFTTQREVELPSGGFLYGDKLPDGKVLIRPMTMREEKLLYSSQSNPSKVFETILDRCLLTKSLPIRDYLVADKLFILLMLRIESYGQEYKFDITCSSCRKKFEHSVNLSDGLDIKTLKHGVKEPLILELPMSNRELSLKLLRVSDEEEISRLLMIAKRKGEDVLGEFIVYTLSRYIHAVDGNSLSPDEALEFVQDLRPGDVSALEDFLDEYDCGPSLNLSIECSNCAEVSERIIPMDITFFRSRPSRRDRS